MIKDKGADKLMKLVLITILAAATLLTGCSTFGKQDSPANKTLASEKKRIKKVISAYTRDIKRNNTDSAAYYNRGKAYIVRGRYNKALSDLNKAIELKPEYAAA